MPPTSPHADRPRLAYIPARYPSSRNAYEHSRRTRWFGPVMASGLILAASSLVMAAAARLDWIPYVAPPRSGVQSLQLTANFAAEPTPAPMVLIEPLVDAREPLSPAATGSLQQQPITVHRRGESPARGMPLPARTERAMTAVAASSESHRAERATEPELTKPVQLVHRRRESNTKPPDTASVAVAASKANEGVRQTTPQVVDNPPPLYPPELLTQSIEGVVLVTATVTGDGRVVRARLRKSSGRKAFDQAALDAVRKWRFNADEDVDPDSTVDVNVPLRFRIVR